MVQVPERRRERAWDWIAVGQFVGEVWRVWRRVSWMLGRVGVSWLLGGEGGRGRF